MEGGSSDNTYGVIEQEIKRREACNVKLFRQSGKGKGDAVRKGFKEATGDVLMILDADLTVRPEDLPRFFDALASGKAEYVNGVRLVYPMQEKAMRFCNFIGNKFFSLAFSWLLGRPVKDTLCGTKVLTRANYEKLARNRKYFGEFDPFGDFDLIFGAAKLNLQFVDIPIRYHDRTYGETNISRWSHGVLLLRMVLFGLNKIKFIPFSSSRDAFDNRKMHEIVHGEKLANGETESIWGWGTPAGRIRAERRARLIAEKAELYEGGQVLEVGCGTGNFTQKFAAYMARIVACDLSENLLAKARERNYGNANVKFVCSPFEECCERGPYDAVIGSSVLHHLDLEQSLPKIYDLLKPGGKVVFAEPNMLNPQVFVERKFRFMFSHISNDETAFVASSLKKKLRAVGFRDIEIIPFDWLHPATPEKMIMKVSKLGALLERMPLIRSFAGSLLISAKK